MHCDIVRWRGFFYQDRKDSGEFMRQMFFFYLKKNRPVFIFYLLAQRFKNSLFAVFAGLIFYLAVYLFMRFPRDKKYISMVEMNTEKKSYRDIFGGEKGRIKLIRRSLWFFFPALKKLFAGQSFMKVRADIHVLKKILRRRDLFVALRTIQYLACYDRFLSELNAADTSAIIVFTDGNPHGRALINAAYKNSIKLCFISHGEPNDPIPPLYCDVAYLFGKRSFVRYSENGSRFGEVLFHGHRDLFKILKTVDFGKKLTIGLFFSKSTRLKEAVKLSFSLRERFYACSVLIRPHPNMPLSAKERAAFLKNPSISISDSGPLESDIGKCDFVIAGDSTVHLDVLLRGCPSFYSSNLEKGYFDRYGYLKDGMVLDWDAGPDQDTSNNFYQKANAEKKISYFLNIEDSSFLTVRKINEAVFK
jgi:hypothetical protein